MKPTRAAAGIRTGFFWIPLRNQLSYSHTSKNKRTWFNFHDYGMNIYSFVHAISTVKINHTE